MEWLECCQQGARPHRQPRSSSISRYCVRRSQVNQHLTLNSIHNGETRKMSQALSHNHHSFNTTNSYNTTNNYITPDDESKILAWLSPLEPRVRHQDIGAQRVDSIGAWLLEAQEFKCWHNGSRGDGSHHPSLFCHGNPGAGKSHMM